MGRLIRGVPALVRLLSGFVAVAGVILVAGAIGFVKTSPLMSLFIGGLGVFWAAMATVFVRKSIRAMAPATTPEQRVDALMQPLSDYMLAMMGIGLLAFLAMLVGVLILVIAGQL
jgi:hypothetical protein